MKQSEKKAEYMLAKLTGFMMEYMMDLPKSPELLRAYREGKDDYKTGKPGLDSLVEVAA